VTDGVVVVTTEVPGGCKGGVVSTTNVATGLVPALPAVSQPHSCCVTAVGQPTQGHGGDASPSSAVATSASLGR
jgi:hypothetical protein